MEIIGLSVSYCFREFGEGTIDPELVEKIISSTGFETRERAQNAVDEVYKPCYSWNDFSVETFFKFWDEGRIEQPRITTGNDAYFHYVGGGTIWRVDGEQITTQELMDRLKDND